ncbi:glycine decarboxylase subunit P [Dimargaris verticillata]|uniref:Glycine cleavage system P protein n=1 Tax=Dimargaris verticillata TaxID=2761393 RepID=A0A9W8EA82_9FUNG|nr:glycine decarboxylase subunit P [Dimargaris verticillata]
MFCQLLPKVRGPMAVATRTTRLLQTLGPAKCSPKAIPATTHLGSRIGAQLIRWRSTGPTNRLQYRSSHAVAHQPAAVTSTSEHLAESRSTSTPTTAPFPSTDQFVDRHIGPSPEDIAVMLKQLQLNNIDQLLDRALPDSIRTPHPLALASGVSEAELLVSLKALASQNELYKSYIGMGYTNTQVPPVILRNLMENPGWYTQYTPYQPEISQGRLEALFNYQTMVSDLTGLAIANASLLDEGTAAAEAMAMCLNASRKKRHTFLVDAACHPQTIACIRTRAQGLGVHVVVDHVATCDLDAVKADLCGILVQYPTTHGQLVDYSPLFTQVHSYGAQVACATDLMALTLLKSPGELGADIALGNSQRFGVPLGYGGPHAAFFACTEEHKRRLPGRIVGLSRDDQGHPAYRLALQTREQHIRREKATSNICTAQALLANMAVMYAIYHGPQGLRAIAHRIHRMTMTLARGLMDLGHQVVNATFFDTLTVRVSTSAAQVLALADAARVNLRRVDAHTVGVTLDETVQASDLEALLQVFGATSAQADLYALERRLTPGWEAHIPGSSSSSAMTVAYPQELHRDSPYLEHPVFNRYHSETEMLRYLYHLQTKDLSLADAMIPLGSCTMKLNATTEMIPVTWPEFAQLHPFAPPTQTRGYRAMLTELERDLAVITGFDGTSLQPNSGAQGEYTGLKCILAYHRANGHPQRNVCFIPASAHGTNAASSVMAGMKVVPLRCCSNGTLDLDDLKAKAHKYRDTLAAIMVTYPSTFGMFEDHIKDVCDLVHEHGGQVYMDGANMNAQIGLTSPGHIGADVCHLNLHKTFCIPHGGGGPGMGPICVKSHLIPFLPATDIATHLGSAADQESVAAEQSASSQAIGAVSAAPYGSASILPISYAYIKMMGGDGLTRASELAILNANYMRSRLAPHYKELFTNQFGMCGHEFVIDISPFSESADIREVDIAKRLQDYSFHSPTMSWPTPNTLMIEPTESESKQELDRFCDALIAIRHEIREIETGQQPRDSNVLKNAPHTMSALLADTWDRPYSREKAAYPLASLRERKFWPTVGRVDDVHGDKVLVCTCPPMSDYDAE